MKRILLAFLIFNSSFLIGTASAQPQPGALDVSFNPGTGANGFIEAVAVQSDGKIIIGGYFTTYNGTGRNSIARLNADGSLDATFDPGTGANSGIIAIAMQSDGKIIISGGFTTYNGTARSRIARLNTDGSLDMTFDPGTGMNSGPHALAMQSDGKIIIGGFFTTYNGTTQNRIARLNADGSLDATFDPGTGANSGIVAMALQSDGKIIIGGHFGVYNNTGISYLARLNADGSLDGTFGIGSGTGPSNTLDGLALQSDGKIIIGGAFSFYSGTARNRIARLNTDSSLDGTFNPGTGADSPVNAIALQSDGKMIIVGDFTTYNGTARNHVARLNADGSLDATFDPGTGASNDVNAIALQSDGKIIIGGGFTTYNGTGRNRVARLRSQALLCDDTSSELFPSVCNSYTAPDAQVYITSDTYIAIIPNAAGCDSTITINLTVDQATSSTVTETVCTSYTAPDAQVYTTSGTYIAIIPNAAGCDSTITINLTVDICVGLTNATVDGISVHPNPSSGIFKVTAPGPGPVRLQVTDALGRKVLERAIVTPCTMDLRNEPNGIYYLQLTTEQDQSTHRLVKE